MVAPPQGRRHTVALAHQTQVEVGVIIKRVRLPLSQGRFLEICRDLLAHTLVCPQRGHLVGELFELRDLRVVGSV